MATQDKNTAMDGLTRRVLSSEAAGAAANAADCPPADLLAAYYERSMDAAETSRFELHFSTCARCRQQLAALVRADESVAADRGARTRPSWLSWFTNQWWLVPVAGTLALAVVIYVGILPRMHTVAVPAGSARVAAPQAAESPAAPANQTSQYADEVVGSRAPAAAQPAAPTEQPEAKRAVPTAAPPSRKVASAAPVTKSGANAVSGARHGNVARLSPPAATSANDQGGALGVTGEATAPAVQTDANAAEPSRPKSQPAPAAQQSEEARAAQSAAAPVPPPAAPPSARRENEVQETQSAQDKTDTKKAQEMPPAPTISGGALRANARGVAGAAGHAATTAKAAPAPAAAKKTPPPSPAPAGGAEKAKVEQKAGNGAGVALYGRAVAAEMRDRNVLIASPDLQSQWRIAEAGFVEHTENGGTTWTGVEPVENAQFVAGASPAARTCWLVGRNGMIAVTTDALHWRVVKPPVRADFTAITAKNGSEATVTAADGTKFSTRDTGKTWQKVE